MAQLPDGDPVPDAGPIPAHFSAAQRDFGVYVHVPFCTVRCGYCDFNTYTAADLGGGVSPDTYPSHVCAEMDLAQAELGRAGIALAPVSSVFFGGGTPTLLQASAIVGLIGHIKARWGLAPGAEVSVEANPDTVDERSLAHLAAGGVTRISLGMQSAVPHVLRTLERTHDPASVPRAVAAARKAGLAVSLDLIYGTPGESLADWEVSLRDAVGLEPDHVSAYALVVEDGTKMAAHVRRGLLPLPSPDDEAAKYERADQVLASAGYQWYEVSNWARSDAQRCRHNLAYWTSQHWWGFGPGAHSHIAGADGSALRWWNVKHPRAYAQRLTSAHSPAAAREVVRGDAAHLERVMLMTRLATGMDVGELAGERRARVAGLIADGLVEPGPALRGLVVPTLRGRLLADVIARELT